VWFQLVKNCKKYCVLRCVVNKINVRVLGPIAQLVRAEDLTALNLQHQKCQGLLLVGCI
jgi:hypothetical protein